MSEAKRITLRQLPRSRPPVVTRQGREAFENLRDLAAIALFVAAAAALCWGLFALLD